MWPYAIYKIVVMVVSVICVAIAIAFIIFDFVATKKIKLHSQRLKHLELLNDSTSFSTVVNERTNQKHYDNKSSFNKMSPAYLMAADIRNNLAYFSDVCEKIKKNREIHKTYTSQYSQITAFITKEECEKLKIPFFFYKAKEEKLFKEAILNPVLDYKYTVIISYSSPKGNVKLRKEESFNLDNIFACLESVSRSRLDKKTYEGLAAVERGEVSDSLRYDIMNRDEFRCVICGASAKEGAHLHVDHIIPIAKGGKSVPSNLRTLCERCNIGKSDKIETSPPKQATPKQNTPKQDTPKQDTPKQEKMICPQCGGELRVRTSQYGHFYGCSNYPKCRYTRNIPEK